MGDSNFFGLLFIIFHLIYIYLYSPLSMYNYMKLIFLISNLVYVSFALKITVIQNNHKKIFKKVEKKRRALLMEDGIRAKLITQETYPLLLFK